MTNEDNILNALNQITDHLGRLNDNVAGLNASFSQLDARVASLEAGQVEIRQTISGMEQRLDGIDQRLDGVDQRLDGLDQRLDGVDLTPYDTGANDGLDNDKWYVSAIRWARANGICSPYRLFSEYQPLTRGEYAVMLYNFLKYRGLNVSASAPIAYADAATLTYEERTAFQFLQFAGVFHGYEDDTIRPGTNLNRAQLAALLHRLSQYIISAETRAF